MEIWIDGDACPREVKTIVFKASQRTKTKVNYIANSLHRNLPVSPLVQVLVVSGLFDAADSHILDNLSDKDLVITGDIPLAYEAIKRHAVVITPRGELLTTESIGEKIALRNLREELRQGGLIRGGPQAFNEKDKKNFAQIFDKILTHGLIKSQRK